MDVNEIASRLNGREYCSELVPGEFEEFKNARIVVAYGRSDDLLEFEGAIYDEYSPFEKIYFNEYGKQIQNRCDNDDCPYHEKEKKHAPYWIKAKGDLPWEWDTNIPHAVFNVMEYGELYGQGIVFSLDDLIRDFDGQ